MGCNASTPPVVVMLGGGGAPSPRRGSATTTSAECVLPPAPLPAPFDLSLFLASNSHACSLDLSNKRCSDLELETDLIPALTPRVRHAASPPRPLPKQEEQMERWMSINLKNNALSSRSIRLLATCLRENQATCNIQALYLHGNNCGDEGLLSLAIAIGDETALRLKILGLDNNNISDVGVGEIARVLARSSLEWLFLNENPITDKGLNAICAVVNDSPLRVLALAKTNISDEGVRQTLLPACARSFRLKQVMLGEEISGALRNDVRGLLEARNSAWYQVRLVMISVKLVPRLGARSNLRALNLDTIRRILDLLPFDPRQPKTIASLPQ